MLLFFLFSILLELLAERTLEKIDRKHLTPVVQRLDNAIRWIIHYPVDKC